MKHGRRDGKPLQYAAARAALWLLNDLPALVESLLFPDNTHAPVRTMQPQLPGTAQRGSVS